MTRIEFAEKYLPEVIKFTSGTGLFPAFVLSQMILESSGKVDGKYIAGQSKLSREANNFFGIKASKSWTGDVYKIRTREEDKNGKEFFTEDNFRKYESPSASIKDYVVFLLSNQRYSKAGIFTADTVKEQAKAIQKAGYATDTKYAALIDSVYRQIKDTFPPSALLKPTLSDKAKALLQAAKPEAKKKIVLGWPFFYWDLLHFSF